MTDTVPDTALARIIDIQEGLKVAKADTATRAKKSHVDAELAAAKADTATRATKTELQGVQGEVDLLLADDLARFASFAEADAWAMSNGAALRLRTVVQVSGDQDLSAALVIERGGGFDVSGTLTLNGPLDAGAYRIFYGEGIVTGAFGGQSVRPWWWGLQESAADDAALKASLEVARSAGVPLDFTIGGRAGRFALAEPLRVTTPGSYDLHNFELDTTLDTTLPHLTFEGSPHDYVAALAADITLGSATVTVAPGAGAGLITGERYFLASTRVYCTAGTTVPKVSEWVTIKSVAGDVVTFTEPLKSSYTTATHAALVHFPMDLRLRLSGVTLRGKPSNPGTTRGLRALRAVVNGVTDCEAYFVRRDAFTFNFSRFDGEVDRIHIEDSDAQGLGYGVNATGGCDAPKIGTVTGKRCGHLAMVGGSGGDFAYVLDGVSRVCTPMGYGGYVRSVHCDDAIRSIFDQHPAHNRLRGPDVSGSMSSASTTQDFGLTLQSSDLVMGDVSISGCRGGLALIQHFGKPSDEPESVVRIASLTGDGDAGFYLVEVQNLDAAIRTGLNTQIGHLSGRGGGLVGAKAIQGDVRVDIDVLSGVSTSLNGINAQSYAEGRSFVTAKVANIRDASGNTARYPVYALGGAYAAGHGQVFGAMVRIDSGRVVKDAVASGTPYSFRTLDGVIELGADVAAPLVTAPPTGANGQFKTSSGSTVTGADVYRSARAAATS